MIEALRAADAAGDVAAARRIAAMIRAADSATPPPAPAAPASPAPAPAVTSTGRGVLRRIDDVVRGAADAATFGFADEIAAGLNSLPALITDEDYSTAYARNLAAERARDKTGGVERVAGQVGGGLATAFAMPATAAARLPAVIRYPGAGALYGGAYGLGSGEGGTQQRTQSAATGAAVGAGLGVVAPAAVSAVKGGARVFTRPGAESRAAKKLANAVRRDEMTPQQAAQKLDDLGPEATIADLGANTTGLGRVVANLPGKGKQIADEVYEARQFSSGSRVMDSSRRTLGSSGDDFYQTLEQTAAARRSAAKPLYDEAYNYPVMYSERLEQFLKSPIGQRALEGARKIFAAETAAARLKGEPVDAPQWFVRLMSGDGVDTATIRQVPTTRLWDYMLRGLDDVLEGYRDRTTGRLVLDTEGRAVAQVRAALDDHVMELNPALKTARNAWAGPTRSMNAMHDGRAFIRHDAEVSADKLRRMTASEREYFLMGVTRGIRDIVTNVQDGASVVRRLLKVPAVREKLRTVFPDEGAYNAFMSDLAREQTFNKTRNALLHGSRTTPLAEEMKDAGLTGLTGIAQDVAAAATGSGWGLFNLAGRAMSPVFNRVRAGVNESTRDALSGMLFTADPAARRQALDQLLLAERRLTANRGLLHGATMGVTAPVYDSP